MMDGDHVHLFEARRAFLTGLAYRILGSLADAEDAVQDSYLKWLHADRGAIENPAAWLTAICARRCIDVLRSARRARVDYVGTWLPEPVQTNAAATPESATELASSLSMAFLLLLERLAPKERAAYLLREIFDQPYADVAIALGVNETACRKLVSRARLNVSHPAARNAVPLARQEALLTTFRLAVETGEIHPLAAMLSEDIELHADGGGKVAANLEPLVGRHGVLDFIAGKLTGFWRTYEWQPAVINGLKGALLYEQGHIKASVNFSCDDDGNISQILIVRNPEKLARFDGRPREMPLQ